MLSNRIGNMAIQLGLNLTKFTSDWKRAARDNKKHAKKMRQDLEKSMKAMAAATASATAALALMVNKTAKTGDQLSKMSQKLGVGVDFLSKYDFIAGQAGTNLETVGTAVKKMEKSINDANNGLTTSIRAFDSLGISLDTLNQLSPEEQFKLLSEAMGKVETQSVKTGAAMDIFGRAGTELIPMFEMSTAEMNKLNDANERFGAVVSDIQANSAVQFTDALDALQRNAEGFSNTLSFALMPALTEIISQFNDSTIRDADDDWQGLQTTLASVYGGVLLVKGAFETVGNALGQIAAKTVDSFVLMATGLESFIKRVHRGSAIIASSFSDDAAATVIELDNEIAALDAKWESLYATIASAPDTTILQDTSKIFEDIFKKIDKVKNAYSKNTKEFKKGDNQLKNTAKGIGEIGKQAGLTEKELNKLDKDFSSIIDKYLTPLERLENQFHSEIDTIDKWLSQQEDFSTAMVTAANLSNAANEAYEAGKKAIEEQLTPYEELIKSMKTELDLIGKKGPELDRAIAVQELARAGIIKTADNQDEYNRKLAEYLGLLEQINSENGIFGDGINSFGDLLGKAFEGGNFFDDMKKGFDNMFNHAENRAENMAQGFAEIANFAQSAIDSFDSHSGKDDVGQALATINDIASSGALGPIAQAVSQVATFVDAITGGRLFGTDYALESAQTNYSIDQSGGGGSQSQTNVRQRSLFRGRQWETITSDLESSAQQAIDSLFNQVGSIFDASALAVGSSLTDIVSGAFEQQFDADGNLTSEISTILGRTYNEDFAGFSQRLIAENIISVLDSVLPQVEQEVTSFVGGFDREFGGIIGGEFTSTQLVGEATALAEQFRSQGAEALLDFANYALQAVADIQSGNELLLSLTDTTGLIQELATSNETLTETYARVSSSTQLLESSLEIIGQSLDLTRDQFIRFSVDITEAAGGVEQAAGLWQSYFDTFYSTQELLDQAIASATANRDDLLAGLGIEPITPEAFRNLFESVLPTLSADAIVQWLQAADAIGVVIDLTADLTAAQEQQAEDLAAMMSDISSAMEDMDLSPFAKSLKDIKDAFNDQIAAARKLGASEKELAMIQRYATRQIKQAIAELENTISSSITDLYGSSLDAIENQISALEEQQSLSQQVAQENIQRYQAELAAIKNIHDYVDSLLLNSTLTPLNLGQQLNEAQSQFDALYAKGKSGDVEALNALPGIASTLLSLGRENYASSQGYTDLFDSVRGQLSSLGISGSEPSVPANYADPRLLDLQEQQRVLLEQIATGERFTEVLALADQIAELTSVTGESFTGLADRLGLPIEQFITDLGVNLETLTIDTAVALADVAQLLGIELTELADSVGVSLGDLADANSLLNDALETTISGLPTGIQTELTPLLQNVENAADGTAQVDALTTLSSYVDNLADDQRDALAPYFEQIDPTTDAQRQIDSMTSINNTNEKIVNSVDKTTQAIIAEQAETQLQIGLVRDEIEDLVKEIRNLASQAAA